jgi:1-acyl-sn-glycerol-3-phosphate acyltransferase
MKFLKILYTSLAAIAFFTFFLLIFPFFWLFIQRESWKPYGHFLNKLWAYLVFGVCFLPTKVVYRYRPSNRKRYVYCANHSSYLDIPTLAFALPGYFMFIGKASLTKLPLFGYMFRNLYIPVDRANSRSKVDTIRKSIEAIKKGRSVAYFPEGTIPKDQAPHMIPFKDGAFRVAIETQVPVVPVTICYNWIIFPDKSPRLITRHLMKVIIHEPIPTEGLTLKDLEDLKGKTYSVLHQEISAHALKVR